MKNKQHHYTGMGVILCIAALPIVGWSAQPMAEGSLARETGVLNQALPLIIEKAQQDAQKPESERWRAQRSLSDGYLREIRINMLADGSLSSYEEQKKNSVLDVREKKKATIKPHEEDSDRYMIYEFESPYVKTAKVRFGRH